jgi:hypothetical protein
MQDLPKWNLVTASYSSYRRSAGVPVRTSVGSPKWFQHDHEFAKVLAPFGIFGNDKYRGEELMRDAYRKKLWSQAAHVEAELDALSFRHPDQHLCMLCYCNVRKGEYCHRRWFAEWITDMYGFQVPEFMPRSNGGSSLIVPFVQGVLDLGI